MRSTQKKEDKKEKAGKETKPLAEPVSRGREIAAVVAAVLIVAVVLTAYVYSLGYFPISKAPTGTIQSFARALNASNTVRIFVSDPNSTIYINTTYCATSFIYQLEKERNIHKPPSSIDFFVVSPNQSCTYSIGLQNASNYTTGTASKCDSISAKSPTIWVNYSSSNSTKVYGNSLYISGDNRYLFECAGAAELT